MNWKKTLKILGFIVLTIIVFIAGLIGYGYYHMKGKYAVNEEKYPHYIGKIESDKAIRTDDFQLCKGGRMYGFYSSAAPKIYRKSKLEFKKTIKTSFKDQNYKDNGYLSLRFNMNCKGKTGNLIITELNSDLGVTTLNSNLVDQLVSLSLQEENWQTVSDTDVNYYMYLLFKIENGTITEILP
ncbi:hypothetical protein [Aquimarina sp. MMG016]|uniref:hypothetical protein n=1 Tax=Aquimarina sp. MMG016 TaxID=2822690 RepID=UPI001B3A71E4|nr:hypothetical protein [Aquimarina sp. MMG016]MBQ4820143.1 hypothetical protein [Aquimarina sp. MMG016]